MLVSTDSMPDNADADRTIVQLTSDMTADVPIMAIAVWQIVLNALIDAEYQKSLLIFVLLKSQ